MAYYALLIAFIGTAALNMLHLRAGFLTNHAADLVVPAWLYIAILGLHSSRGRVTRIQRTFGRTPEVAALSLFVGSAATEVSQHYWPHGLFAGTFDANDILTYAVGLAACYMSDRVAPVLAGGNETDEQRSP